MRTGASAFSWMFRSRETGRITIAQFPNWPLGVWLVATVGERFGGPTWLGDTLTVIAAVGLAIWAADEVYRGVNPFRRLLGAAGLGWLLYRLIAKA